MQILVVLYAQANTEDVLTVRSGAAAVAGFACNQQDDDWHNDDNENDDTDDHAQYPPHSRSLAPSAIFIIILA